MRFLGPGVRPKRLPNVPKIPQLVAKSFGFFYYYAVTLAADASLSDALALDTDADFVWQGVSATVNVTGSVAVRFKDQSGLSFSDNPLPLVAMYPFAANGPFTYLPVWPEVRFPAGGSISMDWVRTGGAGNAIVGLLFRGAKVFSTSRT